MRFALPGILVLMVFSIVGMVFIQGGKDSTGTPAITATVDEGSPMTAAQ